MVLAGCARLAPMTQRLPETPAPDVEELTAEIQRLRERVATLKDRKQHLEQVLKERDARIAALLAERAAARRAPAGPVDYTRRLLSAKGHPRLTKEQLSEIETELGAASLEDVTALFPHDPLLANFVLNIWEWAHGSTQLASNRHARWRGSRKINSRSGATDCS